MPEYIGVRARKFGLIRFGQICLDLDKIERNLGKSERNSGKFEAYPKLSGHIKALVNSVKF